MGEAVPQKRAKYDDAAQDEEPFEIVTDPSKYVTLPIQNERIWRKYQPSLEWFWTVYEVNVDKDRSDMLQIFNTDESQYLQKLVALMVLTHNTLLQKELFLDLINQVDLKEASYYFGSQADSNKTHSMMYTMLLDELTGNPEKSSQTISEVAAIPEVHEALLWYVQNIILEKESFARRLLVLATLQGILFNVAFVTISWIERKHPSKMNGLTKSNQLIWRDERLNFSTSCSLLAEIEDEVERDVQIELIKAACEHAKKIFTSALPVSRVGIDRALMGQFIENLADVLSRDAGGQAIYQATAPFDWIMEPKIDLAEVAPANVMTVPDNSAFELDDDF